MAQNQKSDKKQDPKQNQKQDQKKPNAGKTGSQQKGDQKKK